MERIIKIFGPNDNVVQTIDVSHKSKGSIMREAFKHVDMLNDQYFTVKLFECGQGGEYIEIPRCEWRRPYIDYVEE